MFWKSFWANQNGSAAIMFSLASVPLVVGTGMAVDHVNWRHHETRQQGVADSAALAGAGVTMFKTGTDSGLKLGGASSISISAPTSGTYAGVAFYGDRNSTTQTSSLLGSNSLGVEGTICLPNHDLSYGGSNSTILPADFTILIANTVEFIGSSDVSIRSDFAASDITVPTTILQGRIMPWLIE